MTAALDIRHLASALGGEISNGQVIAPGPGHSKHDRSLAVRPSPDAPEGFVVHSFSGDDALACRDHVRAAAALPDWRPDPRPSAVERIAARGRVVATYDYLDADGGPWLRVCRKEPKGFYQQRWNGTAWEAGKPKGPPIPYRLPDMLAAVHDTVLICEGEKDADALAARGYVATTASEGAGKWSPELNRWFEGKTVYVLPDNDKAGEDHAALVAANLHGVASEVRIVRLPRLPEKGDVSDYIAANGTADLIELCQAAPLYTLRKPAKANDNLKERRASFTADELWDMSFPPVSWIVPDYIAAGLTLLVGAPKLGKSWLALDICNAVARGGYTLGDRHCPKGDVLYAALEDNPRRLKDRLRKSCGSNPGKGLTFWTEMDRLDAGGIEALREWIVAAENPRLIVLDTLMIVRPEKRRDENPYDYDGRCVRPLKELADEFGVAICVIHHTRKAEAGDKLEKVSGTNGLTGAADTTIVLDRDGEGVTLSGRGRDIAEFETALEFQKDICRWRVLGDAREVRQSDERKAILDALAGQADPLSPREIADVSGHPYGGVRYLLHKMASAGEVQKVGRGKYLHPDISPPNIANNANNGDEG